MRGHAQTADQNQPVRINLPTDLIDHVAVEAFFRAEKPEIVFLAAPKIGGIMANNTYKAEHLLTGPLEPTNEPYAIAKVAALKLMDSALMKSGRGTAPSNLAIASRYVLPPEIFPALDMTTPGKGGEIQLTDALRILLQER
ncbi:MAG: hypothetical protein KAU31_15635, partial [Spirochaetaceae bacterium]|nr:hypothetical protein [Spirochaetaceae bacterium]